MGSSKHGIKYMVLNKKIWGNLNSPRPYKINFN